MTVPREKKLVRFYLQIPLNLQEQAMEHSHGPPRVIVEMAERAMAPYKLTYRYCD